ncbi:uncharacterized protein LOC132953784 [Metopolophium dirhodum]|uniref:uncharacterized protein LOC132953784 n=1 Tax=Metopolophium dirhodum TaxID=44670 RepID=UPI00298FF52F|nr:uncharacterized protein LOC132953784 [Metopolophium dirhodum]
MNTEKVLLQNLIASKKNIKRKIMEMKRGVIDSDNYFREAFKPIIEPLNTHTEQNAIWNTQSTELKNKSETSYTSEEDDNDELNSDPLTYQLKDSLNNLILGNLYVQELKKTFFPDTFLIERVIKKHKNKLYVKWLGFDNSHNSWVNVNDTLK